VALKLVGIFWNRNKDILRIQVTMEHGFMLQSSKRVENSSNALQNMKFGERRNLHVLVVDSHRVVDQFVEALALGVD
jgi:hypothetical protein